MWGVRISPRRARALARAFFLVKKAAALTAASGVTHDVQEDLNFHVCARQEECADRPCDRLMNSICEPDAIIGLPNHDHNGDVFWHGVAGVQVIRNTRFSRHEFLADQMIELSSYNDLECPSEATLVAWEA